MMTVNDALKQVSLVCANFGNHETFEAVLNDWIQFLGGRPGEIVVVDGGSRKETTDLYWKLFNEGSIDKLQVIRPTHPDNNKNLCYIQEHTAGAIASKPYLLWFKSDTLPYRVGHDQWLPEALEHLDRDDTFAVGGSFNMPSKHHEGPWPGWYFSHKCSENFSLMKRELFMAAMEEFSGRYITSGFRGTNPAEVTGQERFLVEVAFEKYIEAHQKYTLVRQEDKNWTIFHTNVLGEKLIKVRENYLARVDVDRHMNHGYINPLTGCCYYGQPRRPWKEVQVAFGRSALGPLWRSLKRTWARA